MHVCPTFPPFGDNLVGPLFLEPGLNSCYKEKVVIVVFDVCSKDVMSLCNRAENIQNDCITFIKFEYLQPFFHSLYDVSRDQVSCFQVSKKSEPPI